MGERKVMPRFLRARPFGRGLQGFERLQRVARDSGALALHQLPTVFVAVRRIVVARNQKPETGEPDARVARWP